MSKRTIQPRDTICQSTGESLLRLGSLVRFLLRHGSGMDEVAGDLGVGDKVCALSLAFHTAPDWFKFRAIVEGWNALAIRSQLRSLSGTAAQ